MMRPVLMVGAVLASALALVSPGTLAGATPADEGGKCEFLLVPPAVAPMSGVDFVKTTVGPGECSIHANPASSVVCLMVDGSDSAGQCQKSQGPFAATLYFPYTPGATYVAKGQGCTNTIEPPYTLCQDIAPQRFTL
jgi:hypothetical protein